MLRPAICLFAFCFSVLTCELVLAQSQIDPTTGNVAEVKSSSIEKKLGRLKDPENRITGQVKLVSGLPAARAKLHVTGNYLLEIDAIILTDDRGHFDFVARLPSPALVSLEIRVESSDGMEMAFHRFPWAEKDQVKEGIEVQLQPTRTIEFEVVDPSGKPIEQGQIAFQVGFPYSIHGPATDSFGKGKLKLPQGEKIESVVAWKDNMGLDYRIYSLSREQQADLAAIAPAYPSDRPERLVLSGVKPLTVRVVDDSDKPIAGVNVSPWLLHNDSQPDSLNFSYYSGVFGQDTNEDGEATFKWMPDWQTIPVTLWPSAKGYERLRANYNPQTDDGKLTIALQRLVPVRGRVLDPAGKAISGIDVQAFGVGRSHNDYQDTVQTDEQGNYELLVQPNHIYIVTARRDNEWVSAPQTGFAVFPNQPLNGRDFKLRKPTRVYGILQNEQTREPIANERVIVYHYGTALHDMPNVNLPNPENERYVLNPLIQHYATTNAAGEFEFFLGDGSFDIRPPQQERADKFEITRNDKLNINVVTKIDKTVELTGLVFDNNSQPLAKAKVSGIPRSSGMRDWKAETDTEGKFKVLCRPGPTYILAVSGDQSLAAIQEMDGLSDNVVMNLQPVGSARGRLMDADKKPVAGQQIDFGVRVPGENNRTWSNRFGGKIVTDSNGDFELKFLASDREYELYFPFNAEGVSQRLTAVKVTPGQSLDLGEIAKPAPYVPYKPPTLDENIAEAFNVEGSAVDRHKRALELVALVKQNLLVVFGLPEDPNIRRLMEIRFSDREFRPFRDDYRFMAIPTDKERLIAAKELAEKLSEELPESKQPFQLVIIDSAGQKVASAGMEELCPSGELSKDKLLELLREYLTKPLDAQVLLSEALERAQKENKRILVQETATWCGPCHLLSRLLDGNRVWEKDYIWIKMDQRWTGAKEVMAKIREGAEGGIPWFAILDADGKKLATSNDSKSEENIGFPSDEESKAHFEQVLMTTRQRMSDEEIQSILNAIDGIQ